MRAVLSVAEMQEADALTIATGTPSVALMIRAGQAVAEVCLGRLPGDVSKCKVVVLCGPGKNGGDGLVAATALRLRGCQVSVHLAGQLSALSGDAAEAASGWTGPIEPLADAEFPAGCIIVDALLGAGLARDLSGEIASTIHRVNASDGFVLAVDIPSGVHGDSGAVLGSSISADLTVTFFRSKPGHHLFPGAARCGLLVVEEIGIADAVLNAIKPATALNEPSLWLDCYPWPARAGHKYSRGHAVVVSGCLSQTGAARLSARAALRVGAGLVTLATPASALAVNAAHLTAIMLRTSDGKTGLAALLADKRKNAVVLGPGLGVGAATCALVKTALMSPDAPGDTPRRACVLDADALTSFEGKAGELAALIASAGGPVVITPHDGEFARLFKGDRAVSDSVSKLDRARAAARRLGCAVVLKGADTVVADRDGRGAIATADAPWLATAGSGDVLSGLVGGLLAQGVPPFEAANAAVWIHAAAARHFGPGLIAEDLPDTVPSVLRELKSLDQARKTSNQQRNPASN